MVILVSVMGVVICALVSGLIIVVNRATARQQIFSSNEEVYSQFYKELESQLNLILTTMREVDINGSFESDDEVGSVFKQIKGLIDLLEDFQLENFPETLNAEN